MEHQVCLYDENRQIREIEYLKEIRDEVYWCYYDAKDGRTFRSYFPVEDEIMLPELPFLEVMTMQKKQLLAKDVY